MLQLQHHQLEVPSAIIIELFRSQMKSEVESSVNAGGKLLVTANVVDSSSMYRDARR